MIVEIKPRKIRLEKERGHRKQVAIYYASLRIRFGNAALLRHLPGLREIVWTSAGLKLIEKRSLVERKARKIHKKVKKVKKVKNMKKTGNHPEFCLKNKKRRTSAVICIHCQRICEFSGNQHSSKYERGK